MTEKKTSQVVSLELAKKLLDSGFPEDKLGDGCAETILMELPDVIDGKYLLSNGWNSVAYAEHEPGTYVYTELQYPWRYTGDTLVAAAAAMYIHLAEQNLLPQK